MIKADIPSILSTRHALPRRGIAFEKMRSLSAEMGKSGLCPMDGVRFYEIAFKLGLRLPFHASLTCRAERVDMHSSSEANQTLAERRTVTKFGKSRYFFIRKEVIRSVGFVRVDIRRHSEKEVFTHFTEHSSLLTSQDQTYSPFVQP
ncbi:hypothetical protein FNV43_RR00136 [Rhamnella rubrinervis]|uniref:Uncharacterized protein n=1 Tax=Rhamnella rubrinervis TaxID=2594499 RepID=A0A8K0HMA1_9ROSA|nr:hypothetical protein FNV43_RR00136 [Rhamnella rubrinervis]